MRYEMATRFNNCIVIPAKAGIQYSRALEIESQALGLLDARLRGHDGV